MVKERREIEIIVSFNWQDFDPMGSYQSLIYIIPKVLGNLFGRLFVRAIYMCFIIHCPRLKVSHRQDPYVSARGFT